MIVTPGEINTSQLHHYLIGAVAPRPICFASTLDAAGKPNLSPYSFFNVFGSNPPILIFSPSRKVRNNSLKHTLENIQETGEVVINVVNYAMVQQMSLSSCEYPKGVDEFEKAGFHKLPSQVVKPWRLAESPVQIECQVMQIIETGTEGGAGNLIICKVVMMHIDDTILDDQSRIDPQKIDLVARMGGDYYCRASGHAVFIVPKPNANLGIGVDALPESIRTSTVLTGNHLGMLGNVQEMPSVDPTFHDKHLADIIQYYSINTGEMEGESHLYAAALLKEGRTADAWQVLLATIAP